MKPFTVLTGRSGAGKTDRLLELAVSKIRAGERVLWLTSEPYTFDAERALCRALGGPLFDAEALGFSRLAEKVLRSSRGGARLFLSPDGKRMALRRVLSEKAGELSLYRRVSARSGFSDQAGELIDLFKAAGVAPDALRGAAKALGDPLLDAKLSDIALLYEGLEDFMAGRYIDQADAQNLLLEQLPHSSYLKNLHVFLDVPHGYLYTHQTYAVLAGLIETCASFTMTLRLPGETDPDRSLFLSEERALEKLRALGRLQELPLPEKGRADPRPAGVRALEPLLFSQEIPQAPLPDTGVSLLAAGTLREEVDGVLSRIDRLLASGAAPGEIYLVPGDASRYGPALRAGLARRGLVLFWEERRPLSSHPVVELTLASLQSALKNFRREEVLRAAKSGFSPLTNDEAELFEDYVLRFGVNFGGFCAPFTRGEDSRPALLFAAEQARQKLLPPLMALRESLKAAKTAKELCKALYDYLLSIGLWEKLNDSVSLWKEEGRLDAAAENAQVWNALLELLDQIAELMDGPLDAQAFVQILDEGFAAHTIGMIPPAANQIGCGDVQTASGRTLSHLFVLGCNEGLLPQSAQDDGIINDRDISRLSAAGIDAFPGTQGRAAHERHIVYALLSRPTGSLTVSWALSDEQGTPLSPSPVADRLCALFPKAVQKSAPLPAAAATCEEEGFYALVRGLRLLVDSGEAQEGLDAVYAYYANHPAYRARLSEAENRLFGGEGMSAKDAAALYGPWRGSTVTRLEQFNRCPFSYLVNYGLKPDARKPFEEAAPDEGNFYHGALDAFFRKVRQNKLDWTALTDDLIEQLLSEITDDLLLSHNSGLLTDGAQNRRLGEEMRRAIGRTLKAAVRQIQAGRFVPLMTEARLGQALPALAIPLPDGERAVLAGTIDRLDIFEGKDGKYVRVIDYKTGQKTFSYSDLCGGLTLQLPLYLKAAEALGAPGGMFYLHIDDPIAEAAPDAEADEADEAKVYRLRGLILDDEAVVAAMDGQTGGGYSPYLPVRFTKNGPSGDALLSGRQFELLLSYAEDKAAHTICRILSGEADVSPARMGGWTACDWCDYRAVCRFEPVRGGQFRTVAKVKGPEFFAQLETEEETGKEETRGSAPDPARGTFEKVPLDPENFQK